MRSQDGSSLQNLPLQSSGLEQRGGYEALNRQQPSFRLAEDLRFELDIASRTNGRIANIRFLPDGSIDETSLQALQICQGNRQNPREDERPSEVMWIVQARDGSRYEIVDETNALERLLPQTGFGGRIYTR